MITYDELIDKKEKLALVGLGSVGIPIAVAFSKKVNVIGFDQDKGKIELYRKGIDPTNEVGNKEIAECAIDFTSESSKLKEAKFIIVAVPTPIKDNYTPDLNPIKNACRYIGKNLSKGAIVIFESTVYPGVTEEICVPIMEYESHLKCGIDFKVGYSPERINPGDKVHRLENITKIVSGMDKETLDTSAAVYGLIVKAGIYKAESIKIAEAAKVIENSQRDINIAFMNEVAIICDKIGIDTKSVLRAAETKWNFLNFSPGLVGGHCIGIDPYYLTYKAEKVGYHSQIILAGRRINDNMGKYVTENLVKNLIRANISVKAARVAILGFTFKENCPDVRNTKVVNIYDEVKSYGMEPFIVDPVADANEVRKMYGIELMNMEELSDLDAIVVAVPHDCFASFSKRDLDKLYKRCNEKRVLIDIKGLYEKTDYESEYYYWRL